MKHVIIALTFALFAGTSAQAACFAHYKAKQENPLKLAYGVMQVTDADCSGASDTNAVVSNRLLQNGWTLLNIVKVTPNAPTATEEQNAGAHFLRF